jgi:hypothetical protein
MRQRDSALARLILVDVLWSEWNSGTDRKKYVEIIEELLMPPPTEAADVGSAYLHMCYEKDPEPWVVQQAPYELPPRDDCHNPKLWHEGQGEQSQAVARLYTGSAPEPKAGKIQVHGVAEWGQFFRIRIFMHATRYRAAVSCKGDADYWALIDMRFQRVSENLVLWHTGLSVWSGLPWNAHHRPAGLQFKDSQAMSSTDADRLTNDFHEHSREGFRDYLRRKKVAPMELRVFDRVYEPPPSFSSLSLHPRPTIGYRNTESVSGVMISAISMTSSGICRTQSSGLGAMNHTRAPY